MKRFLFILLFIPTLSFGQQITLTWEYPFPNETEFRIKRKAEPCAGPGSFTQIAIVPANTLTYVDKTGTFGQFYCYTVTAANPTSESPQATPVGKVFPYPTLTVPPANLQVQ